MVKKAATPKRKKPLPLFIKVSAKGKKLPVSAKDWAAVVCTQHRSKNGLPLMFTARDLGSHTWAEAPKVAAACRLLGEKDWYLGDAIEVQFMLDRSKYPALDPKFFHGEPSWHWTSTPASGSSFAFPVGFSSGLVGWGGRLSSGLVRACREVPPRQALAFGIAL